VEKETRTSARATGPDHYGSGRQVSIGGLLQQLAQLSALAHFLTGAANELKLLVCGLALLRSCHC